MSNDPHRNLYSAYADRPAAQEDLSWLDFLRSNGVPGPPSAEPRPPPLDRSNSADRKRRHTGTELERRNYPYPTYGGRPAEVRLASNTLAGHAAQPGSSLETAVDLTTPPRRPRPRPSITRMHQSGDGGIDGGRRGSDVPLPKWQPDQEVNKCPVCHNDFTFLYRRHHCRKCGRVVCANCSPHRITIPRQYIVQPPSPYGEDEAPLSSSRPDSRGHSGLGGGETVRVCNPCVPDPWMPAATPTPAPEPVPPPAGDWWERTGGSQPMNQESLTEVMSRDPRIYLHRDARLVTREAIERERPNRYRVVSPTGTIRNRALSYQPAANPRPSQWLPGMPASFSGTRADPRLVARSGHRHSQSSGDNSMSVNRVPLPIPTTSPPPAPQRARREVKEEDECPVCGTEMPPGESVREAHIQECIASRFSSTPTQPSRSAPPQTSAAAAPPPAETATSPTPVNPPRPVAEGSRPRATSYRPRGMALYRATEKDCSDEDGEPQECVICFEEFQVGDEMGRMECLCKFHRLCIRQWWDTKGAGSCPTHQLHD